MIDPRSSHGKAKPIRVLVVDDSAVQRGVLVSVLDADSELRVVGWAADGEEAIRAAATLKPDVITMDLRMPAMDGLEATRRIMQETPTPIVIVTASLSREVQQLVFAAFQAGALAIIAKPMPGAHGAPGVQELLQTVKSMAQVKVIRRWAPGRLRPTAAFPPAPLPPRPTRPPEIVAIGASTGGPGVLQEILTQLPSTFRVPLLVVQHIAPDFVTPLIEWLGPQCSLPVRLATMRLLLDHPAIYVAPPGKHLSVRGRAMALTDAPAVRGHRPSATVLFASVAAHYGESAIGVLLTGMGDDGASGLRDLKHAGGVTIAQDQASSAVFGMPAAAIDMGIVDHVLPPSAIAPLLIDLAARG